MKKKALSTILLAVFLIGNLTAGGTIQNGTPVSVKLINQISSSSDDQPNFVVSDDVKDSEGNILIKQGTVVNTEFARKQRKSVGLPGSLSVKFVSTTSADGQMIPLAGSKTYTAPDKKGKVIGVAVGVGLFIWPMLAYLAKKGEDVTVAPTTIFNAATVMGSINVK
jgi:hypothetical protein